MRDSLSPDEWRRVDSLFQAALDWPASEREDRLRTACEGDTELFEAVTGLLAAASDSGEFLEISPILPRDALAGIMAEPDDTHLIGQRVGRYRILRPLGRGGMASVWLAERDDGQFRRQVALKIVRQGLDTADVLSRFHSERQILSSLEHPNIARMYDGGTTDDGRPYLALEYVEGRPITEYCDELGCSVDERLQLFLDVGRAVQFAHGRLVIHRDIKPSNILVGLDGVPKLLDFGIAKLLDPTEEISHHTRTGAQPLTLRYASPEQIRGEAVTTASDVYQLGLLLYRLLTGSFPYAEADDSRWALQEAILREPARAASRVAKTITARKARSRGASKQKLSRRLSGDLDTILLKALAKEPGERYSSAIEFVEDLRRHLDGRPIAAKRAGTAYRMRKYFQRNRWAVPALAAAAVALAGYVFTVERHGRQLEAERNMAQAEARRATAVRDFLTDIFETARPDGGGTEMSVSELVDRAADQIAEEFSPHPSVLAELSATLGSIFLSLGRREEARQHLERAVFLLEGEPEGRARDERLALALRRLSGAVWGLDVDSAARLATRAYDLAAGIRPSTFDASFVILETAHQALPADRDSARRARRQAIEVLRRDPGRREILAAALQDVAHDGGEEALALQEEALRIRRELFGDRHSSVAASLNDLAMIYDQREPGSGDSLMLRAIETDREVLGPAHRTTLSIMNNYAWMLKERGAGEAAASVFREVLAERKRAYPDEQWALAYPLHGLGLTLMEIDRHPEAEEALRETVRVLVEHGGDEGRLANLTAIARSSLARCLLAQGRLDEAEQLVWLVLEDTSSKPEMKDSNRGASRLLEQIAVARSEAALQN